MRKVILFMWCVLPILWVCFHYGPGQEYLKREKSAELIMQAEQLEKEEKWLEAQLVYDKALSALPAENTDKEKMFISLKKAKTYLNTSDVGEAATQLETLLTVAQNSPHADKKLLDDIRGTLAHSLYYSAWHMRLQGIPRKRWMQELEHSRQNFRLLAENKGDSPLKKNLESAIHLSRIDLNKLKGMALPDKNAGCGS